ncbi:MAG: hypothetical protein IKX51_09385 [Bacteroidales bacterium]|nr:hypothetical protein [Bacteroidales bacterium]
MTTLTASDKRRFLLLRAISIAQIVVGVAFIVLSYGKLSTPATIVLCTVTFLGVLTTAFRKDVAAWLLLTTSLVWFMQMMDTFIYFLFYMTFRMDVFVYAIAMSVLSVANLFLADYFWAKTNGKPFKPKRLCLILCIVMSFLPTISFAYRSYDIDDVSYRLYLPENQHELPKIIFTNNGDTAHIATIYEKDAALAIRANSDRDSTYYFSSSCRVRIKTRFTAITSIKLIKNASTDQFYDDAAEIPVSKLTSGGFKMSLSDLWW